MGKLVGNVTFNSRATSSSLDQRSKIAKELKKTQALHHRSSVSTWWCGPLPKCGLDPKSGINFRGSQQDP